MDARLRECLTIDDLEALGRANLSKAAYDYYRSGADAETTLRANREAFAKYTIWYRVLVDVSSPKLATRVLGTDVAFPILIAPTAYHRMACEGGECATARVAEAAGTIMVVSTLATTALDEVARASNGPKWFQLYVHKDRAFTRDMIALAEASGYRALVITVDTPILGRRLADERNGFSLPQGLTMPNLVSPDGELAGAGEASGSMLGRYVAARHDASMTFRDIEAIAASTNLPVVLKGIVRSDDAERAAMHGVKGVIVSNHGARQLDGAPATIDALGPIAERIGDRVEVMMDGGIRWGTDVLKAIGLGAKAVLVGRPILWGLAAGGEEGAAHAIAILRQELARAMALAGCPDLAAAKDDLVR